MTGADIKNHVHRTMEIARAFPNERITYAYIPADSLDALNIEGDMEEVKATHPSGVYLWVEYYPDDARMPWRLGVYWIDERTSEDPIEYPNMYEVMWRMLDDAEYFTSEPKPLHGR